MLHGCLPVVIMDDVDPVFASILDWDSFSVRVPEVSTACTPEPSQQRRDIALPCVQLPLMLLHSSQVCIAS